MARSRINLPFVLIVLGVLGATAFVVGAMWYLRVSGDATRHLSAGDEFMAAGEYRKAKTSYSRAVGKEPASLEYLALLEEALSKIRPETRDDANELYKERIRVLKHAVAHYPEDAVQHGRLLDELATAARNTQHILYWELLDTEARNMWSQVPEGNPERVRAKLYIAMAAMNARMYDRFTEEDIAQAELGLDEYLAADPASDVGWGLAISGRLARADYLRNGGMAEQADDELAEAHEVMATALERAPDGPEVNVAALRLTLYDLGMKKIEATDPVLRERAERAVATGASSEDGWIVSQLGRSLDLLPSDIEGLPGGDEIIDAFVAKHPERPDLTYSKGRMQYLRDELDEAVASARAVLTAEIVPVSYLSAFQFEMRRQAAMLLVDVAMRRWDRLVEERPARLAEMEEELAALEAMTADPDTDALVRRARGKVAYARGEFARAADLFDGLVREALAPDVELLIFAAASLEEIDDLGRAMSHIDRAISTQPSNSTLFVRKARLLGLMSRYGEGIEYLTRLLEIDPANKEAEDLRTKLRGLQDSVENRNTDPVFIALTTAQLALDDGDYDAARSVLLAALEKVPDDVRLIHGLLRTELVAGNIEAAKEWLGKGRALVADAPLWDALDASINSNDPVAATVRFVTSEYTDETERSVTLVLSLWRMSRVQKQRALMLRAEGKEEEAAEADALGAAAKVELEKYREQALTLAPDHPGTIEFLFVEAVEGEKWEEARRAVEKARLHNIDQAQGFMYEGRYHFGRHDHAEAARAFLRATELVPYSSNAWRSLAVAYERVGNFPAALRAFESANQNNPTDVVTVLALSEIMRRMGLGTQALLVLRDGRRVAPANAALREAWLTLEAEVGDATVALEQRRGIFKNTPHDASNSTALALYLGTMRPTREMLTDKDGSSITADEWRRRAPQERDRMIDELQEEWIVEADRVLDGMRTPAKRDLPWHMLKAELLRQRGQDAAGEDLLRAYVANPTGGEERLDLVLGLGLYLRQAGRLLQAEELLTEAKQLQSPDMREGDLALAGLYYTLQRFDDAISHFEAVLEVNSTRTTQLQRIESLIKLRRFDEAGEDLQSVVAESGSDFVTTMLEVSIADGRGETLYRAGSKEAADAEYDKLPDLLTRAEEMNPGNPMPHVLKARAFHHRYSRTKDVVLLDDALLALDKADQVRADFAQTALTRAQVLQSKGDIPGMINQLTQVLERAPREEQTRTLLLRTLLAEGRFDDAMELAREGVRLHPRSAAWHEHLGDFYMNHDGRPEDAAKEYAEAVDLEGVSILMRKYAEAELAKDPPDTVAAIRMIEKHRDQLEADPRLRGVYADALNRSGRRAEALEQITLSWETFRKAIETKEVPPAALSMWAQDVRQLFREEQNEEMEKFVREVIGGEPDPNAMRYLARLWRTGGGEKGALRAVELLQLAISRIDISQTEQWVGLHWELGRALIQAGKPTEAIVAYETLLVSEPDNVEALNNVAYMLIKVDPARALPYAKRAAELQPTDAAIRDTVGWIQFKLRQLEEAETSIRGSIAMEKSAANHCHLAYVLFDRGDIDMADRYLQDAAELEADEEVRKEIDELADLIRARRTGAGGGG